MSAHLDPVSETVSANTSPVMFHLPLYLWRALKQKVNEAYQRGQVSKETFDRVVTNGLGVARREANGVVMIEQEIVPILREVLNTSTDRSPPLEDQDVINFLVAHEQESHEVVEGVPGRVDALLHALQASELYRHSYVPNYETLKRWFANNYGKEYLDDTEFIRELPAMLVTEEVLLRQPLRLLPDDADPLTERIDLPPAIARAIRQIITDERLKSEPEVLVAMSADGEDRVEVRLGADGSGRYVSCAAAIAMALGTLAAGGDAEAGVAAVVGEGKPRPPWVTIPKPSTIELAPEPTNEDTQRAIRRYRTVVRSTQITSVAD